MAGMHFIILKVNGVDVSQMPHEEAVQMFLKASEPILVEVRRQSYNTNTDAENLSSNKLLEKSYHLPHELKQQQNCPSKQSSPAKMCLTTSTSPTEQSHQQSNKLPASLRKGTPAIVDSIKFHSLILSSKSSTELNNCFTARQSGDVIAEKSETTSPNNATSIQSVSSASGTNHYNRSFVNFKSSSPCIVPITSSPYRSTPPSPIQGESKNNNGFKSIGIQTDNFNSDFIFNASSIINPEEIIESNQNLFSECLAPDIDIEEITLRKSEGNERLGLTVCYSSGGGNGSGSDDTDTCTEVYISDIVADSIAGRDGRLRQGDQILQVNGKDVSNKEETETLIAENNNAVTLLVSRYLYGDEDEYNVQEDYYEEEEPNIGYAKCFLEDYIVDEDLCTSASKDSLDKKQQQDELIQNEQQSQAVRSISDVIDPQNFEDVKTAPTLDSSSTKDPLNHQNIRAHLEQVTQEIAKLDSRVESMMISQKKNNESTSGVVQKLPHNTQSQQDSQPKDIITMPLMDYDTEHIYETIPEDSESEPFYCSPYEGSDHQNRVEQWLGMQESSESNEFRTRLFQPFKQQFVQQHHENLSIWTKTKNGTLCSTNSSAGDDHENSSSAYNTGGSCNSNTMAPLTLELNAFSYRDRDHNPHSQSTLVLCSTKNPVSPLNETTSQMQHRLPPMHNSTQELQQSTSIVNQQRHSKEKLPSPSHSVVKTSSQTMLPNKQKIFHTSQKNSDILIKSTQNNINTPVTVASNTMYTNVANLQQTMLLQQQLFRQALIHKRVPTNSVPCPQFTAPNLSQYHFVSSQEVSTVKLNTHPNEEHMVWKVKRRQDGTRYIVRRPARNRFLRNRALRINAERNDQTTEDDTISEIKTGRYWTREERKKHIERAREKRQRQQIIITNKNNEISMLPSTSVLNNLSSEAAQKNLYNLGNDSVAIQQNQQQQKLAPTIQSSTATGGAKVFRQNNSSLSTKRVVKKNTTNNIADGNVTANNASIITSNSSVTGTPITTSTTTPTGGTRMFQGSNVTIGSVSDNINYYQTRINHTPM